MNSKMFKSGAILACAYVSTQEANAIVVSEQHKSAGIFGAMIEQATAGERLAEEKHEASQRKQKQLDEAQKDYDLSVQQEEREEAAKLKKEQDEAENQAIEAAKNTPTAKMMQAANEAATGINVQDIEANIQANLQSKIAAGASQTEILASVGSEDLTTSPAAQSLAATSSTSAESVMSKVLAKNHIKMAAPVAAPIAAPVAAPVAAAVTAAPAQSSVDAADEKASQEKVKELAQKLGVPFTQDLLSLGSNSAISDALIEKAVSAGKSVAQINAAMSTL